MRSDMHGMELSVQSDEVCKTLEQYNPQDMLCVKGRPPRYDSACNVSTIFSHGYEYLTTTRTCTKYLNGQ